MTADSPITFTATPDDWPADARHRLADGNLPAAIQAVHEAINAPQHIAALKHPQAAGFLNPIRTEADAAMRVSSGSADKVSAHVTVLKAVRWLATPAGMAHVDAIQAETEATHRAAQEAMAPGNMLAGLRQRRIAVTLDDEGNLRAPPGDAARLTVPDLASLAQHKAGIAALLAAEAEAGRPVIVA